MDNLNIKNKLLTQQYSLDQLPELIEHALSFYSSHDTAIHVVKGLVPDHYHYQVDQTYNELLLNRYPMDEIDLMRVLVSYELNAEENLIYPIDLLILNLLRSNKLGTVLRYIKKWFKEDPEKCERLQMEAAASIVIKSVPVESALASKVNTRDLLLFLTTCANKDLPDAVELLTTVYERLDEVIEKGNQDDIDNLLLLFGDASSFKEFDQVILNVRERISALSVARYVDGMHKLIDLAIDADTYTYGMLELEAAVRVPSFLNAADTLDKIDRNGHRIRVFTGDKLTPAQKKAIAIYAFTQYACPEIDHDRKQGEKIPFFDSSVIQNKKLYWEDLDTFFTNSPHEYHVVITDAEGKINGYVGLEAPLCEDDPDINFSSERTTDQLYYIEQLYGSAVLKDFAPEFSTAPVKTAVEIRRLAPRANGEIKNRDRLIIAFELALALAKLTPRLINEGRLYAICDTEMEKIGQIFTVLLGIDPMHVETPPNLENLKEPYNELLKPRYTNNEERTRQVSVVAFELEVLVKAELVARRNKFEEILAEYAKTKDPTEQREIINKLLTQAMTFSAPVATRLGRIEFNIDLLKQREVVLSEG